jgi:hypothetical protein
MDPPHDLDQSYTKHDLKSATKPKKSDRKITSQKSTIVTLRVQDIEPAHPPKQKNKPNWISKHKKLLFILFLILFAFFAFWYIHFWKDRIDMDTEDSSEVLEGCEKDMEETLDGVEESGLVDQGNGCFGVARSIFVQGRRLRFII